MTHQDPPSLAELTTALERLTEQAAFLVDDGPEGFLADTTPASIRVLAASHLVVQFAALLEDVPGEIADAMPDLPWRAVREMRNRLAHGYMDIDGALLWAVVARDLPSFASALRQEIRRRR